MGVEHVAIDDGTTEAAVAMLARGFPARPAAHWRDGLARMRASGENARLGVPLGRLLRVDGTDVGVLLTPAGEQVDPDGGVRRVVNLSSWYLEPDHRWRAPIMLKGAMADPTATYTDLTPTKPVQAIIRALGFRVFNEGVVVAATSVAALVPGRSTVVDLAEVPAGALPDRLRANLEAHRRLGCLALAAVDGHRYVPLLVRPIRLKRLPGAQLIYCGDHAVLPGALPLLARRLLARGRLVLLLDLAGDGAKIPGGVTFRGRSFRFVKGPAPAGVTDLTWSEFAYFDVYS